jgi:uroporphyrin-III C-methyltransferase / precorrin-2 dehydrogenase / sirohydrochlorin ferrochelatase
MPGMESMSCGGVCWARADAASASAHAATNSGRTGIDIILTGMREPWATGSMHAMRVASLGMTQARGGRNDCPMDALPVFIRLHGQPVLLVGDGAAAEAKARLIAAAGGVVVRDMAAGVRLAFVALDDADAAADAAARLKAAGMLVNVVDRPALCDFTVPAIVDRSPVIVAIGTGGASATLAKALRERFEALLPATLGGLASAIRGARDAVRAVAPTGDDRRRLWDTALAPGGPLDPLVEHPDPVAAVAGLRAVDAAPRLHEIRLASADPDDLTLRQLRWLSQADTVFHTPDVPAALLDRVRRDAARVCVTACPDPLPAGRSVWLHG